MKDIENASLFVIKRDGRKVPFNREKIVIAIEKANNSVKRNERIKKKDIEDIAVKIENAAKESKKPMTIEKIQDAVEDSLISLNAKEVAKSYIKYRYRRSLVRQSNTTDEAIRDLIEGTNDYWNYENSNKNAKLVTTQRDYMAGITSTDIAKRFIFPKDAVDAHEKGAIHIHE